MMRLSPTIRIILVSFAAVLLTPEANGLEDDDSTVIDVLALYSRSAMCAHTGIPPCNTIAMGDAIDEYSYPDFASLKVHWTNDLVVVEVGFWSPVNTASLEEVHLYGTTREIISFGTGSNTFTLRRDDDWDGFFEEEVFVGQIVGNMAEGEPLVFEIPIEYIPDIDQRQIYLYSLASTDRIPDTGFVTFPDTSSSHCCERADANDKELRLAIETEIALNVHLTNAAFIMSGVDDVVLNLVDVRMDEHTYDQDETLEDILASLVNRGQGGELGFTDTHGPDIVAYLADRNYLHEESNSATDEQEGYFVVVRDAKHQYEFTHAVGHLLGLDHHNAFCYSKPPDNVEPTDGTPCFKTLMGDTCSCNDGTDSSYVPRVLLFSSPDINWSDITLNANQPSVPIIKQKVARVADRRQSTGGSWTGQDISKDKMKYKLAVVYDMETLCSILSPVEQEECEATEEKVNAIYTEIMANINLLNTALVQSKVTNMYVELVEWGEGTTVEDTCKNALGGSCNIDEYLDKYSCAEERGNMDNNEYVHDGNNGYSYYRQFDFSRNSKQGWVFPHEVIYWCGHGAHSSDGVCHDRNIGGGLCFKTIRFGREDPCDCVSAVGTEIDTNYVPRVGLFSNPSIEYNGLFLVPTSGDDCVTKTMEKAKAVEQENINDPCIRWCDRFPKDCGMVELPPVVPRPPLLCDRFPGLCGPPPESICQRIPELCERPPIVLPDLDPALVPLRDVFPAAVQKMCTVCPDTCFRKIALADALIDDLCDPDPCKDEEICVDQGDGTHRCEIDDPCDPNPCGDNEICINQGDGTHSCEIDDPCDPDPCKDNEICIDQGDGTHRCERDNPPIDNSWSWCFSGFNVVEVKNRGIIPIEELQIGDYVKTSTKGDYSRVYSFAHRDREAIAAFIRIDTEDGRSLEISADHILFANGRAALAKDIEVGDMLGTNQTVANVGVVQSRGLYSPLSNEGEMLVSGVRTSNYMKILDIDPTLQVMAYHAMMFPLRVICGLLTEMCKGETYIGGVSDKFYKGLALGRLAQILDRRLQLVLLVLLLPVLSILASIYWLLPSSLLFTLVTAWLACRIAHTSEKHVKKTT